MISSLAYSLPIKRREHHQHVEDYFHLAIAAVKRIEHYHGTPAVHINLRGGDENCRYTQVSNGEKISERKALRILKSQLTKILQNQQK